MNITVTIPLEEGPMWLGDLRLEVRGSKVVFTAQSSKGRDKYSWTVDQGDLSRALGMVGFQP